MTTQRAWLIFDLDDTRLGVDAMLVRETVWLPELTPAEEAPPYIAGIFSLRGQIVPVTDLRLRFGHPTQPYRISDQIVILELDKRLMGMIVSEVREVIELSTEAIQPPPRYDGETRRLAQLVCGEVQVGDELVTLLDARQLVHQLQAPSIPPLPRAGEGWGEGGGAEQTSSAHHFCPEATPEQRAIFRARASALMEAATEEEGSHLQLAVVGLGDEYFGMELHVVQEFCDIAQPSPIPCCPPHVLGAISLRGDLLTLLDLRGALGLPHATQRSGKAVIARLGEQAVGVAVDEVHDVVYLRADELQAAPAVLRDQHGAEVKGAAPYAGRMMAVLDLPALLAREEWIVNEQC